MRRGRSWPGGSGGARGATPTLWRACIKAPRRRGSGGSRAAPPICFARLLDCAHARATRRGICAARRHADTVGGGAAAAGEGSDPSTIAGKEAGPRGHAAYTAFVNAAGRAAASLPCEPSAPGLPIRFQLVAPPGTTKGCACSRTNTNRGALGEPAALAPVSVGRGPPAWRHDVSDDGGRGPPDDTHNEGSSERLTRSRTPSLGKLEAIGGMEGRREERLGS